MALYEVKNIPLELNSEWKIRKAYEKIPGFVEPESILLGHRFEQEPTLDGSTESVRTDNIGQYVSISKTVKSLLQDEDIVDKIKKTQDEKAKTTGVYSCFQDGLRFEAIKHTNLLERAQWESDKELLFINLMLYYDSFPVTRLISGAASLQSTAAFFFSINDFPPSSHASLDNIHLVALANSQDLKANKREGMNRILEIIADEFAEGFDVVLPDGRCSHIKINLSLFTSDNLSLNEVMGFIENFTNDHFV